MQNDTYLIDSLLKVSCDSSVCVSRCEQTLSLDLKIN